MSYDVKLNSIERIEHRTEKTNVMSFIHKTLAILVIAWLNKGLFTYTASYIPDTLNVGFFALWLAIACTSNTKFISRLVFKSWPLLFAMVYLATLSLFIQDPYIQKYLKVFLYIIMVYALYLFYVSDEHRKFQKVIVMLIFADISFVAVNTFLKLQSNPLLSRYLSTSEQMRENLLGVTTMNGVGDYGYFYALVPVILFLAYLVINKNGKRVIPTVLLLTYFVILVEASFTIALIFVLAFIGGMLILRNYRKHPFVVLFLMAILLLFYYDGAFAWAFNYLADISSISPELSIRFREMSMLLSNHNIGGTDVQDRTFRYMASIDTFKHNVLFGSTVYHSSYTVGGHSEWLDLLGRFGLFSLPVFYFLFKAYKQILSDAPARFVAFVNTYWLYFLLVGIINTLLFTNVVVICFLFIPLALKVFNKDNAESDKLGG